MPICSISEYLSIFITKQTCKLKVIYSYLWFIPVIYYIWFFGRCFLYLSFRDYLFVFHIGGTEFGKWYLNFFLTTVPDRTMLSWEHSVWSILVKQNGCKCSAHFPCTNWKSWVMNTKLTFLIYVLLHLIFVDVPFTVASRHIYRI